MVGGPGFEPGASRSRTVRRASAANNDHAECCNGSGVGPQVTRAHRDQPSGPKLKFRGRPASLRADEKSAIAFNPMDEARLAGAVEHQTVFAQRLAERDRTGNRRDTQAP